MISTATRVSLPLSWDEIIRSSDRDLRRLVAERYRVAFEETERLVSDLAAIGGSLSLCRPEAGEDVEATGAEVVAAVSVLASVTGGRRQACRHCGALFDPGPRAQRRYCRDECRDEVRRATWRAAGRKKRERALVAAAAGEVAS